jgi:hypothetical protein
MHHPTSHPGHPILRRLGHALPIVLLSGLLASSTASAGTFATSDSTFPVIGPSVESDSGLGVLLIEGHGFTPGGLVFIAIHDMWGMTQHETRWVTASEISYQPPQDLPYDEGFSFDTGGNFAESFRIEVGSVEVPDGSQNPALGAVTSQPTAMAGVACAASLMVMAYDRSTAAWSNMAEVELGC